MTEAKTSALAKCLEGLLNKEGMIAPKLNMLKVRAPSLGQPRLPQGSFHRSRLFRREYGSADRQKNGGRRPSKID